LLSSWRIVSVGWGLVIIKKQGEGGTYRCHRCGASASPGVGQGLVIQKGEWGGGYAPSLSSWRAATCGVGWGLAGEGVGVRTVLVVVAHHYLVLGGD
jgi:hypothetical protein